MKKDFGGQRLGSGSKMEVALRNYNRSTHDLGYLWRSTMACGTLVPFLVEPALPGDTFDIDLDAEVRTNPTLGPLFGSFKLQCDIFEIPMRLYNAQLHNNRVGLGMNMQNVLFPQMNMASNLLTPGPTSFQINPSCIFAYLGMVGLGWGTGASVARKCNAMPYLAYWDIVKNYYANKQETNAWVLHTPAIAIVNTITSVATYGSGGSLVVSYNVTGTPAGVQQQLNIQYPNGTVISQAIGNQIRLTDNNGVVYQPSDIYTGYYLTNNGGIAPTIAFTNPKIQTSFVKWVYQAAGDPTQAVPVLTSFPLLNIDTMRDNILAANNTVPYTIGSGSSDPYDLPFQNASGIFSQTYSQEGLAVKTYQSDLFNNWMNVTNFNAITNASAIAIVSNTLFIDQINLQEKVYNLLNRIAVSGGSYEDWIETVYTSEYIARTEIPVYQGGLSKEILFQEVVSMAGANNSGQTNPTIQPLGTLAGKGIMGKKHKGGKVIVKVKEPSYIMGIVSITPRIDYSNGNRWFVNLQNMYQLHVPQLDEIGFQDLVTDWMAYWDTQVDASYNVTTYSAGKQPAWIHYMTNVNRCYGNFALPNNQMFMTLNRRYGQVNGSGRISDATTYIDPSHYNFIFAQTSLDAQNFWTQIAVNMIARRVMSAKVIPNL